MIKKFFAYELMIIGVILMIAGIAYGTINYDCTEYITCDGLEFTECVEWDTNQQIGFSTSTLGLIILVNGIVLMCVFQEKIV